jgi:hypothetical protein
MTRALMIGTKEVAAIRATYEQARANPIPWSVLQTQILPEQGVTLATLKNRRPGSRPMSYQVNVPHGYRMAISFEEQPAGLVAHFSFSVDDAPNKLPNQHAVAMLLGVVNYDLHEAREHWVEEFLINGERGGLAINLVYLVGDSTVVAGHA